MAVLSYASISEIRRSIRQCRLIRFIYRKEEVIAEPYFFGNARKTRAYVLRAWQLRPEAGYQYYRLGEMRDLELLKEAFTPRDSFDANDKYFGEMDTIVR